MKSVDLQVTGDLRKMSALQTQLEAYGICEVKKKFLDLSLISSQTRSLLCLAILMVCVL